MSEGELEQRVERATCRPHACWGRKESKGLCGGSGDEERSRRGRERSVGTAERSRERGRESAPACSGVAIESSECVRVFVAGYSGLFYENKTHDLSRSLTHGRAPRRGWPRPPASANAHGLAARAAGSRSPPDGATRASPPPHAVPRC